MTDEEALERIAHERLFTVEQAANAVGVSQWTVRQWVNREHLEPVPGIRPITFFASDVFDCRTARRGARHAERVSTSAAAWAAVQ